MLNSFPEHAGQEAHNKGQEKYLSLQRYNRRLQIHKSCTYATNISQ